MTEATFQIIVFLLVMLTPAAVAGAFYRWLPLNTADVTGPLRGLNIKLGGAFAAYIVALIFAIQIRPQSDIHYSVWTIEGTVDVQSVPGDPEPNLNDMFVRFVPPRLSIMNEGRFAWEIPVIEDIAGRRQFPALQLDLRGYRGLTVPLNTDRAYGAQIVEMVHDHDRRLILIKNPLILQSVRVGQAYTSRSAETAIVQVPAPPNVETAAPPAAAAGSKP